ncbi:UNVERIFIED_CONTAM: hypothetical protein PYX00_001607 [Menopon gallinae]|uniref:Phytanoyl-CoA dioxygenase domain containing 1 n=1 Tax=Menopon gallinae TaxID=328185 RepID=A0AAW2IF19_9NEOP
MKNMDKFDLEFVKKGFCVLEDFFTEAEVDEMREAGIKLTENIPEETARVIFNTTSSPQTKSLYFLESNDKIRYFFEDGALDKDGKLLVEPKYSLNKAGHALHWLHPVFKKYTFCDKIKAVCQKLGMEQPCVAQSMYIYKNPEIGSEVITHQDASYLYTEPENCLVGFWIALEDATKENGCLWFAPGSHRSGVHRRFIRNPDPNSDDLLMYTNPEPVYSSSHFIPVPVRKGTLILISGLVVHRSEPNRSTKSRHVYTFHVVDVGAGKYSPENWLQPSEKLPFPNIYKYN